MDLAAAVTTISVDLSEHKSIQYSAGSAITVLVASEAGAYAGAAACVGLGFGDLACTAVGAGIGALVAWAGQQLFNYVYDETAKL